MRRVPLARRYLFADASTLPQSAVDQVAAIPGVQWAAPVRTSYTILDLHGRKVAVGARRAFGISVGQHQPDLAVVRNERTGEVQRAIPALDRAVGPADTREFG